jgi:predicted nucleotidyltransferase
MLTDALASHSHVVAAAIYGSWARDELHSESDIDLLILARGGIRWSEIREALNVIEEFAGRDIHFAGYPVDHFLGRGISPFGFLARVLSGPMIPLVGDVRALRPPHRSKEYVPRVARDRGIHYGRHRGYRYGERG